MVHPDLRNNNPNKSQWTITEADETAVFGRALNENWLIDRDGWGFHFANTGISYLGVAQDRSTNVFLAKFRDGDRTGHWHGYPADHIRNNRDRPPEKPTEKLDELR